MQDETGLVPFESTVLRGERVLVLAPHPDDEILGCGGLLARLPKQSCRIRVLIATDGGGSLEETEARAAVTARRHGESTRGLAMLGVDDVRFFDLPDGSLAAHADETHRLIATEILAFLPDLILAPSPVEIHPDHVALSHALYVAIASDPVITTAIAGARVACYEVSQPLRPNALVDISAQLDLKLAALGAHESQLGGIDYAAAVRGLNGFRALTLGPSRKAAEGYRVTTVEAVRTTSWEALRREASGITTTIEPVRSNPEVTVVIRTKDRPQLLREAIQSVRSNEFPARIVVVNDGGASVRDVVGEVELIEHESPAGRSAAMNAGVAAARASHIAFLDDDDLYFPEHLATIASAAATGAHVGWYTDSVSIVYATADDGRQVELRRERVYEQDFDSDLLLLTNYIPLTTLLVRRDDYLDCGGFAADLELFEDWDFLLRLAKRGALRRVPRLTVAIRHMPGTGSALLAAPEESAAYQQARQQVWLRNGVLANAAGVARGIDRLRQRAHAVEEQRRLTYEAKRRLASFVRVSRESRLALEEARMLVGSELALSPKRKQRVDEILARTFETQRAALEAIARHDDDPGDVPENQPLAVTAMSDGEIDSLRRELAAAKQALDDIHRSSLWKLGSMYWRLLHALGILKIEPSTAPTAGRAK